MKILSRIFRAGIPLESRSAIVTFTGGMGAQIISAAIYWHLKECGREVRADLTYFDRSERVATVGNAGEVSHWSWQLGPFGLERSSFDEAGIYAKRDVDLIEDGPRKMALGIAALRTKGMQARLPVMGVPPGVLPAGFENDYLCIHVRRGDYVNVASHLVSDHEFFELAGKFVGLVKHLVVVSDSPIESVFRNAISTGFEQTVFLDDIDAYASHCVMRKARALICSNSQFSLIAALLNPQALVVLPKQWFGEKDKAIEVPIHEACGFQLLGGVG